MPTQTTNYRLIKPDNEDHYDIGDFNKNADIIDAGIKAASDSAAAANAAAKAISDSLVPNTSAFGYVPETPWLQFHSDSNSTMHYRGFGNMVFVRVRKLNANAAVVQGTLPVGFRPGFTPTVAVPGETSGTIVINTGGIVSSGIARSFNTIVSFTTFA
jgi:hypothetical protein